jgi:hypothetical protein
MPYIGGQLGLRQMDQLAGALGDAHGLVADPLEVAVDLDHREDESEIDGHGLLLGKQLVAHLVDLALGHVDRGLVLAHVLAERRVALQVGIDRGLERLLGERSHSQQLVLQLRELLMKVNTRHGRGSSVSIVHESASVQVRVLLGYAPMTISGVSASPVAARLTLVLIYSASIKSAHDAFT